MCDEITYPFLNFNGFTETPTYIGEVQPYYSDVIWVVLRLSSPKTELIVEKFRTDT